MIVSQLREKLKKQLRALKTEEEISRCCSSDEFTVNICRYELLNSISTKEDRTTYRDEKETDKSKDKKQTNKTKDKEITDKKRCIVVYLKNDTVAWILSESKRVLEMVLYSGGTVNEGTINVLRCVMKRDNGARKGWRLKLAVAIAITFGDGDFREGQPVVGIPSYYSDEGPPIDGLKRYDYFVKSAEQGWLCELFFKLSAWHMRYVVGARVSDEQLDWARRNGKSRFKTADKIGDLADNMITEKKMRLGIPYTNLKEFYCTRWVTLDDIYTHGGGCGALAHFGMAMVQAHGLPAVLLDLPKQVSYAWYKDGTEWVVCGNDSFNIKHWKGAKLPSKWCDIKEWEAGTSILHMEEQQSNPEKWRVVHTAQIITRMMHPEWQLEKKLSPLEDGITTVLEHVDDRAFYNVEGRIDSDLEDFFGDCSDYAIAKELGFIPPTPSKSEAQQGNQTCNLPFAPSFEKDSIIACFGDLSEIRKIELEWRSPKYAPYRLYITYKLGEKIVLSTENIAVVPKTLIDSVTIDLHFKNNRHFDIFKMDGLLMKGISYSPVQLLVGLVGKRLSSNKLAKLCLELILENC